MFQSELCSSLLCRRRLTNHPETIRSSAPDDLQSIASCRQVIGWMQEIFQLVPDTKDSSTQHVVGYRAQAHGARYTAQSTWATAEAEHNSVGYITRFTINIKWWYLTAYVLHLTITKRILVDVIFAITWTCEHIASLTHCTVHPIIP